LWGAPRIHGELLKLGIDVSEAIEIAESTVAKYMIKRPGRPGQSWRTFLRNHADGIVAVDFFIVPTIGFKLLYGLMLLSHGRRQLVHYAVTAHPTAEWVAQQIIEAFPWDERPRYLVRDRDAVYGEVVKRLSLPKTPSRLKRGAKGRFVSRSPRGALARSMNWPALSEVTWVPCQQRVSRDRLGFVSPSSLIAPVVSLMRSAKFPDLFCRGS
jgi:hypothetical protein